MASRRSNKSHKVLTFSCHQYSAAHLSRRSPMSGCVPLLRYRPCPDSRQLRAMTLDLNQNMKPASLIHVQDLFAMLCCVLLGLRTRCVPISFLRMRHSMQPQTTIFKQAIELGAQSFNDLTDKVTHVLATEPGSAKYTVSAIYQRNMKRSTKSRSVQ